MRKAAKRQILFWLSAAILFVGLIALLNDILLPFIVAIGIAYFLDPPLALVILLPLLANQLKALVAGLPDQFQALRAFIETQGKAWFGEGFSELQTGLDAAFIELTKGWRSLAGEIVVKLLSGGLAVLNVLSLVLITPVVAFYMLADWEKMTAKIDSWLPRDHAPTIRRLSAEINDVLAGFIRGQGTVCLLLAIFYAIGLSWTGLNYSLLIGIIAGFAAFVPYVGAALTFLLAGAVALHQFLPEWLPLAKVLVVLVAGQAIEGTILSPRIVGGHVRLHPVWLIFALFVFGYLFGFVGLLVAVPTAAAIGVVARYGLSEYLESEVYMGQAARAKPKHRADSDDAAPASENDGGGQVPGKKEVREVTAGSGPEEQLEKSGKQQKTT